MPLRFSTRSQQLRVETLWPLWPRPGPPQPPTAVLSRLLSLLFQQETSSGLLDSIIPMAFPEDSTGFSVIIKTNPGEFPWLPVHPDFPRPTLFLASELGTGGVAPWNLTETSLRG